MDVFDKQAALDAALHWGFGADAQLSLLCISENATYLVTDPTTREQGVLRLNRPGYHSRRAIESELAWTAALRREGVVNTPAWRRTRQGPGVALLEPGAAPRHAVMFSFAPGTEPAPGDASAGMPAIGEIAARLHTHARRWTRPEGFSRFAWDLPAALGDAREPGRWGDWRAGAGPELVATLQAAQAAVVAALTAYGQGPERFGLIHGDLRAANLLVDTDTGNETDTLTVIDFDDCGMSWYGYDLAAAVSFLEHRIELAELVAGFLAGYRRSAPFGTDDIAVLPALIM
ncbi:MAG: aminoglycoside phosphotransferase, partial [Mycobacterium sp.]|nr:aminoglycoside phosphotransferase [Mycobacterium sp.]